MLTKCMRRSIQLPAFVQRVCSGVQFVQLRHNSSEARLQHVGTAVPEMNEEKTYKIGQTFLHKVCDTSLLLIFLCFMV